MELSQGGALPLWDIVPHCSPTWLLPCVTPLPQSPLAFPGSISHGNTCRKGSPGGLLPKNQTGTPPGCKCQSLNSNSDSTTHCGHCLKESHPPEKMTTTSQQTRKQEDRRPTLGLSPMPRPGCVSPPPQAPDSCRLWRVLPGQHAWRHDGGERH